MDLQRIGVPRIRGEKPVSQVGQGMYVNMVEAGNDVTFFQTGRLGGAFIRNAFNQQSGFCIFHGNTYFGRSGPSIPVVCST